ncbi:hypothetical protein RQM65_02635 [Pricia sp. S334]|uniref:Right-handed parallel beta-helix repeat-containing protein n=1 Tax=Pricia mediterranea TaxID=3076079 RepID=A0ABU3L1F8_9FLAO|nr:hypothetical protein [Pricia sp. S334]MDT7827560.1 hypothetical protein [Pricia sp. S334]
MTRNFTIALIMVVGTLSLSAQKIITVDNSEGSAAQFDDLQTAIFSAEDGDILYIHPSEIDYGNIIVNKGLTLIGFAHSDPDKETSIARINLDENSSNSRFSGLHVKGNFYVGESRSSATLSNITIENCRIDGTMDFPTANVDNVTIRGSIFYHLGTTSNYTNALITNNIITGNLYVKNYQSVNIRNNLFLNGSVRNLGYRTGTITIQNSILYTSGGSRNWNYDGVVFENCMTHAVNGSNHVPLAGTNNIDNIDPQFVDDTERPGYYNELTDDFHLKQGSLAIDAGVSGEDIGLYDGSGFTFNNFGYTGGIPTVKITAMTTTVAPGNNINVTINAQNH